MVSPVLHSEMLFHSPRLQRVIIGVFLILIYGVNYNSSPVSVLFDTGVLVFLIKWIIKENTVTTVRTNSHDKLNFHFFSHFLNLSPRYKMCNVRLEKSQPSLWHWSVYSALFLHAALFCRHPQSIKFHMLDCNFILLLINRAVKARTKKEIYPGFIKPPVLLLWHCDCPHVKLLNCWSKYVLIYDWSKV